jgi:thiamine-phosphate pyrophosphorylase
MEDSERLVRTLITAGVHAIQLREKQLSDRDLLVLARAIRRWTAGSRTQFIVNDRPDIAALAQADGVHLGQDDATVADARKVVGGDMPVGVSTHSLEQAQRAVLEGADYIGVGPVFSSQTKNFEQLAGTELLREVASQIRLPAFAIGGITAENLTQVLAAGFERVAVGAAITRSADPAAAVQSLLTGLAAASA